ncbi:histidine kinase [Dyadobacter psychrotolerans]|uniref:Histidine kinase n=2 Tax=Dyadobacter psychrotolerans TaxID=2541721 RepID=A0A4R5E310_9BACT|nr:histidine kinase [Dyadobacter psychrotolerans]
MDVLSKPFREKGLIYDHWQYVTFPDISLVLAIYFSFLFLNGYVFPKYQFVKKWNWLGFWSLVTFIFLACCTATSFRYQHILNNPNFLEGFIHNLPLAVQIFLVLFFYGAAKTLIQFYLLDQTQSQTLKAKILREFVVVFSLWALVLFVLIFTGNGSFGLVWLTIVPLGYFIYALNLYWLIPGFQKKGRMLYLSRLSISILGICFSFFVFFQIVGPNRIAADPDAFIPLAIVSSVIAVSFSWFVYSQNKQQLQQLYTLKTELGKSSADLSFLRSQINPHFLFNVLNTLYGTAIQENAERTSEGIQKLGDMMRFMLYENNLDLIPVAREIEYLKDYIHLQKLRLARSEQVVVEVNISDVPCHHSIAPMLLIPFVENAFKHGISFLNKSWINVSLGFEGNRLEFDIHNSIHAKTETDPESEHGGIGLENVKQRLQLLYPRRHELTIRQSQMEYFVHISIILEP